MQPVSTRGVHTSPQSSQSVSNATPVQAVARNREHSHGQTSQALPIQRDFTAQNSTQPQGNVSANRFRYAYNDDGMFICKVTTAENTFPTRLIKVETHDPAYHTGTRRKQKKVDLKIKSEDSTDSE